MSNKCEWRDGKFEGCTGVRMSTMDVKTSIGCGVFSYCPYCGADIREPEKPSIDEKETLFETWWIDNVALQPPLIHPGDSDVMIAKKYCQLGFFGCYELQDSTK